MSADAPRLLLRPLAGLIALAVAACAQAPAGSPGEAARPPSAAAAADSVPLPPGDWTIVYAGEQEVHRGESARSIHVSVDRGVVDRAVLVYRVHLGLRYGFLPRESCSDPAYWFERSSDADAQPGTGACWHVRAVNLGVAEKPHWVSLLMAYYADNQNLYLPAVMIGVRYVRHHQGDLVQIDYLWNPDLLLPPPAGRVWEPADWSNEAVAADPRKQAIMRVLRGWGEEWEPRVAPALPF
jgi:hypothetical protein